MQLAGENARVSCAANLLSAEKKAAFEIIRDASISLFETLGVSCTVHTTHTAHFKLQAEVDNLQRQSVQFQLALRRRSDNSMASTPLWLSIQTSGTSGKKSRSDSAVCGSATSIGAVTTTSQRKSVPTPKAAVSTANAINNKKQKVDPNDPHGSRINKIPAVLTLTAQSESALSTPSDALLPNLCQYHNFCAMLKARMEKAQSRSECIGYLELSSMTSSIKPLKHLVYLQTKPTEPTPTSLIQLLETARDDINSKLSKLQCVSLAKMLSLAVLHFHATPWLKMGSWRSRDILLMTGPTSDTLDLTLEPPYINVEMQKADPATYPAIVPPSSKALNQALYGFALLLIEIALQAPLEALQPEASVESGLGAQLEDLGGTLNRVTKEIGIRYRKVVHHCLSCFPDVGVTDLNDPALLEEFYVKVFCELEKLETLLKQI